jgi:hypothetical protein
MPGHHEHDLERRLREERLEAQDEFVQSLAAEVRGRRSHPSARPRLTLAFAVSLALLVSMIAFGGVGAAKDAVSSSTDTVKQTFGDGEGEHHHHHHHRKPDDDQYNTKVLICVREVHHVSTKEDDERKSSEERNSHRTRTIVYETERVPLSRVPHLVSKGAVYPVPAGGCSALNHPAPNDSDGDNDGD